MDPIKFGLFKPLTAVQGTEGINGGTPSRSIQRTGEIPGGNPFAAISKIDGEVTPNVGAVGSSYTNGPEVGHSLHTKNWLF